ncbi:MULTISPECIES: glycerophosphodiester phosphodiesterase [unclassified Brevibacterium]|uniref:glycerophosphodiester phosphodiesterase n=1 Tax=unclassified Brevibacterium TaxID=2614124 RepID=UPI001091AF8C|nr:glycerophosphodiester phosphodiesterase [Brevibacterium sp. S22]TGD29142.1 glycerophosphodiester phosphodiesterase [Brevibacterium sp. S22]
MRRQNAKSTSIRPLTVIAAGVLTASATFSAGLAPATAVGLGSAGDSPGLGSPSDYAAPDKVADIEFPTTISHRGGADVYPEESMEGFTASAKDGFLPEMDIQFLEDGTPVLIHDDTADRTLSGVTGPIRDLSREEWDAATIKHPAGGEEAATVTLDELLDEMGGDVVLVPEIKPGATSAEVDQVLDEFDERGLADSLIVQSFDFAAAKTIAERGYTSLYLTGPTMPDEPLDEIKHAGIEWVGPSTKLPTNDMRTLDKAGFHVAPYTLETAKDGHRLPGWIDGFFTDDAWSD